MAYFIKNADLVVADTADDIANIPTNLNHIGAITVVAENGAKYILSPSRTWVEFSTGGGSDLPAVTAEDNGDVLTVVNGQWDKAAPGGGGGVLVVNVTDGVCDKTAGEMLSAYLNGAVTVKMDVGPLQRYNSVCFVSTGIAGYAFYVAETSGDFSGYLASGEDDYPTLDA